MKYLFNKKVLFLGFKNDKFSNAAAKYLKKFTKHSIILLQENKIGQKLPKKFIKNYDYILSFKTKIILQNNLLKKVKKFSINFHTGPSKYPGIGASARSILNNDKTFGTTIHLMNKNIDDGKIIYETKFKYKKTDVGNLIKLSYQDHIKTFKHFIINLDRFGEEYILSAINKKKLKWGKKVNQKKLEKLKMIKLKSNKTTLDRYIRAFSYNDYKPYIIFNGTRFEPK